MIKHFDKRSGVGQFTHFLRRGLRQGTWPILQRYVVLPAILQLPPIKISRDSDIGIHCLISEADSLMLHWAIRSLLSVCENQFQLIIHEDGTCTDRTLEQFQQTFIGAKVIRRRDAASKINELSGFPTVKKWWPTSRKLHMKSIDFYLFGETEWVIFLDSDVLFFDFPAELFAAEETIWMRDSSYMLDILPDESVSFFGGHPLLPINTGLGKIRRSKFSLELAEAFLQRLQPRDDMTLNAVITAQDANYNLLPSSYDCTTQLGLEGKIAKHYTTPFRFWFYEEGLPRVASHLELSLHQWLQERP